MQESTKLNYVEFASLDIPAQKRFLKVRLAGLLPIMAVNTVRLAMLAWTEGFFLHNV